MTIMLLIAAATAPLITIPGNVLQAPAGEANYCFNDATGAAVCEYRPPEQTKPKPTAPPPPANVPSERRGRQRA